MQRVFKYVYTFCFFILFCAPLAARQSESIPNCEVLFTSQHKVAEELIRSIRHEKESIRVAVYCLMHRGISKALIDAKKKGVSVEVVVDPFSVKSRAPLKKMAEAGIPIYVWNSSPIATTSKLGIPRSRKSLMHHKFCVFGGDKVWTGSFNFTFDAATNHRENVVVIGNAHVAEKYLKEFEDLKTTGSISYASYLKKGK